ncbi:type III secretion system protein [Providencia rettgeri]|nr:type III secretion system protein [Providencia rettgeri]
MSIQLMSNQVSFKEAYQDNQSTSQVNVIQQTNEGLKSFEMGLTEINASKTVSMSQLLALLSQVIESSSSLRSVIQINKIEEAKETVSLAKMVAEVKKDDAHLKFGIKLASGVMNMGLSTVAAVRTGQIKTVQDKHLSKLGGGEKARVSDLPASKINDIAASLQQQRTAKYNMVNQTAGAADNLIGSVNEMIYASNVQTQEEVKSSIDLKEKYDAQLTEFINSLATTLAEIRKALETIQSASLVTNL